MRSVSLFVAALGVTASFVAACSNFNQGSADATAGDAPLLVFDGSSPDGHLGQDVHAPDVHAGDVGRPDEASTQPDGGSGGDATLHDASLDSSSSDAGLDAPQEQADAASDVMVAPIDAGPDVLLSDAGCLDGGGCPEVIADNLNQATLVVVDETNVYFGDEGTITGNVYQCPKTGCVGAPIALGAGYATGLAVDGTNVYWNDFSGGTIVSCTIGGCANDPKVIAPSQPSAEGVTFDGTNLYWASAGNIVTCVAPGCSTRTNLATGQASNIVHLASETNEVFWSTGSQIDGCPAAGCTSPGVVSSSGSGASIVAKNHLVYFTNGNAVLSCPETGCTTPRTIGSSFDPYGIGTDGVDVYWLDDESWVVYRCPVTGCVGSAEHFAEGIEAQPGANVALDGEYAYFTIPNQVLRKHK